MKSVHAVILVALIWLIAGAFYYPKWNKPFTEAAISWDVSGYYHYLPAIFIYHDLKTQAYMEEINKKYLPSAAYDQSFGHVNSGNKVNKYAIGQAVLYSPFFLLAHVYTKATDSFPADGYSKPYQISIWLGSLIFSILGLLLLRKILGFYFNDSNIGWTILALGLGTHWLEYASISNGMNHTWLFTLLCGLILFTIRFYKRYDWISALGIGGCLGLAILTRPTELIWALVPVLWGITSIRDRFSFLITHWQKCAVAIIVTGLIMSIQMFYWKYAAGEWIVYSYGEQGFDWLHPQIWRGLKGANIGWWLYTPLMLFATIGWIFLFRKHKPIFWPTFLVNLLAIYITFSWGHWESGGGLGQRNLIQVYPLLSFPLAAIITWLNRKTFGKIIWIILLLANIYYSMWWAHQAHKGGFFQPGQMTRAYFLNVAGRLHPDREYFKLLDTNEYFKGTPKDQRNILLHDFEKDSTACEIILADSTKAACMNGEVQYVGPFHIPFDDACKEWLRVEADFNVISREWDVWKYAQWIVQFHKGDQVVKSNFIRVQRHIPTDNTLVHIFFDIRIPGSEFDKCVVTFWNAGSTNTISIDNLQASCFTE